MLNIGHILSRSAAPLSVGRVRRLIRQFAPLLALALVAALGCREDAQSPTAPESELALATTGTTAALSFRQVSAGGSPTDPGHACGVTTDDRAYCWGNNEDGQLGNGTNSGPEVCNETWPCSIRPVAVLGGLRFRHVSAGGHSTCGITTDDKAYCWGYNANGQLGDGTQIRRLTPVAVAGGRRFRQAARATATPSRSPRSTRPTAGATMPTASSATAPPPGASPRCGWPAGTSGAS
jgi:hypothetical protein